MWPLIFYQVCLKQVNLAKRGVCPLVFASGKQHLRPWNPWQEGLCLPGSLGQCNSAAPSHINTVIERVVGGGGK